MRADVATSRDTEERIGAGYGRLKWTRDGDELVAGPYRIRLAMPGLWETTYRGRTLRVDARRSQAFVGAEHHHREVQRLQQIARWVLTAGVAFLVAVIASQRLITLLGFVVFAVAIWVFLAAGVRCFAAINRSLLDPYRIRESWESADWWNH
ncbi:MAG: hypothetical protein WAM81_10295 [Acidimicrobiia bacterium]